MFGKASFNKSSFNKGSTTLGLFVTIISAFSTDEPYISARVDVGETSASAAFDMDSPSLSFKVPLKGVEIPFAFSGEADLSCRVALGSVDIESQFEVDVASLRTLDSEEFRLNGIGLRPGDTLVIDTDTLDIFVNGEVDVESWVSGGVFFQLKPGGNVIEVFTAPSDIQLEIRVQWADRFL